MTLEKVLKNNGYILTAKISEDSFGRYHCVVKNKNNNEFFIKAVKNAKNYKYKSLIAEAEVTKILGEITQGKKVTCGEYRIIIPKVEKIIDEEGFLILLTKNIKGKNALSLSSQDQAKILEKTYELVLKLNKHINFSAIDKYLKTYSKGKILREALPRLVRAIIKCRKKTVSLIRVAVSLKDLFKVSDSKYLVHADINASNIIVDARTIYLTDWEECGIGIAEYNVITPLSVHWNDTHIRTKLLNTLDNKKWLIKPLLAYRTLVLFNQNIKDGDPRRLRDNSLLEYFNEK